MWGGRERGGGEGGSAGAGTERGEGKERGAGERQLWTGCRVRQARLTGHMAVQVLLQGGHKVGVSVWTSRAPHNSRPSGAPQHRRRLGEEQDQGDAPVACTCSGIPARPARPRGSRGQGRGGERGGDEQQSWDPPRR